jgi:glutathione peroxidase
MSNTSKTLFSKNACNTNINQTSINQTTISSLVMLEEKTMINIFPKYLSLSNLSKMFSTMFIMFILLMLMLALPLGMGFAGVLQAQTDSITIRGNIVIADVSQAQTGFYDYKVTDIDGNEFDMSQLKGKKILIVNVASRCGLTPQYTKLQELYEKYGDKNFVIIAFPANNFRGQEPGTNAEIKEFCTQNYSVTFPIMSKIDVVGENKAPIYQWLTEKDKNGKMDVEVIWNFQKFMVDENGNLVDSVHPREDPFCEKIVLWIENQ